MPAVRVGILGYGVIGKRVADAVRLQSDMTVSGVAGPPESPSLDLARLLGYPVCHAGDLITRCDVLLDCTPSGVPAQYASLYDRHPEVTVIAQGGENHTFGGVSFNAFANYGEARGRRRLRVISCSSTGITRFVYALNRFFGLEQAFVSLFRRAADPGKRSKTPLNALTPVLGQSHHAPDVKTVLPGLNLYSMSLDCCTTLGHVVAVQADVRRPVRREDVLAAFEGMPRVVVGEGLRSTADLAEYFQDLGRPRRDRPEIYVWAEGVQVAGRTVLATFSVHMESITIPETIDAVRAALGMEADAWVSVRRTDTALGIAKGPGCYPPVAMP
jgi:glyceraldehyde-3-phosphate dehydrogenase (NAD(P))